MSYEIHIGPVPEGLNVLHTCDNKPCINPDHLVVGTTQDNIDDMIVKGRDGFTGERNGRCLLTRIQVEAIRQMLGDDIAQARIAEQYGVSRSTIAAIKSGRNWSAA